MSDISANEFKLAIADYVLLYRKELQNKQALIAHANGQNEEIKKLKAEIEALNKPKPKKKGK